MQRGDTGRASRYPFTSIGGWVVAGAGKRAARRTPTFLSGMPQYLLVRDTDGAILGEVDSLEAALSIVKNRAASFGIESGRCFSGPCMGSGLASIAVDVVDGEVRLTHAME